MKRFLLLLCCMLVVVSLKADGWIITYRQEILQFKEDVCKLTVKINYWDHETWTYWYDADGNVARYLVQKYKGDKQLLSTEVVTLTPGGRLLTSSKTTYNNGVKVGTVTDTCKAYEEGNILEIPKPKLETGYYQIPGKKDKKGNWLQVSRSHRKYSEIISREFAYRSAMPASVKSEFENIESAREGIKSYFEHKAEIAAQKEANQKRGLTYASFVIGAIVLFLYLCLFMNIRNTIMYKNVKKSKSNSKTKPINVKRTPGMTDEEYFTKVQYEMWVNNKSLVSSFLEKDLERGSNSLRYNPYAYNRHPKSLYWKVLLAIFMWPWLFAPVAMAGEEATVVGIMFGGVIALVAFILGIWWLIKGVKFISQNMVLNRDLSNNNITMFVVAMVAMTGVFGIHPLLSSQMPNFISAFLTFVGLCLYYAIVLGKVTTGRCPQCHAYYETTWLGEEHRGLTVERSREHSTKTKNDVTIRKTHLRTQTYENYANLYECDECGHQWESRGRRLISDKRQLEDLDFD